MIQSELRDAIIRYRDALLRKNAAYRHLADTRDKFHAAGRDINTAEEDLARAVTRLREAAVQELENEIE